MKKEYRIKKNEEFSSIIKHKKQFVSKCFVLYYTQKKLDHTRVGISVSRKIGNAVLRNKIKRQVRMMCLDIIDFKTCDFDYIIIVKKPYLDNNYIYNRNDLEKLLKKDII